MKIAIGADHAGFELKERLRATLSQLGHEVRDLGTYSTESTDYPDYARAVARAVAAGEAERGLLVCYTGAGMAMAANKVHGIRAANVCDVEGARLTRAHNDANVLAIGSRRLSPTEAEEVVEQFLATPFDGGRHQRRVEKIERLEDPATS